MEEGEFGIDDWDELFELYETFCSALDAERGIERSWITREAFQEWVRGLAPHVRQQSITNWRKGYQQVIAEGTTGFERYRWGELLRITLEGEG